MRKCEHDRDGLVALDKLIQIGRLLSRTALRWPHHHKRDASGRRRLVPDDRLCGDRACDVLTKGMKPHLKRSLRTRVSLSDNFLVQPDDVVTPLVPS
ncbi:MAG TPA: hypothetical protein VGN34_08460, partial [Ktedonobacteraceae bacterium]